MNIKQTQLLIICTAILCFSLILFAFAITTNTNSTAMAVYSSEEAIEVNLDFPVDAWRTDGWGECVSADATVAELTNFCVKKGYTGLFGYTTTEGGSSKFLIPSETCYQTQMAQRYKWDGKFPMVKGTATNTGLALTKIKCLKYIPADEASGGSSNSGSSGSSQSSITVKDACKKLCGCST
jgi:hypothetical protein